MASQGRFFRLCRRILRIQYARFRQIGEADITGPVVYICRHRNAKGPVSALCLLPMNTLPWVISAFMKRDTCIDHMKNYTFSVTWKRGPQQARRLANLCGPLFSRLVRSTGAIPVYRNSLQVRETFRQSIDALSAGSSLLIFPDVDYSRESGDIDALYDGFLLLEQLWHRRTGEHIRFVPVNVSLTKKTIVIGKSISFSDKLSFHEEKSLVAKRLQDTLNQMAREYGA